MSSPTVSVRVNGQDVDNSLALSDRHFRGAWDLEGNHIIVNMDRARKIQRDLLRQDRAPRLIELDTAYMRALEGSLDTSAIVEAKQVLRNITIDPRIDAAETPEELKELTLDFLLATPVGEP